MTESTATSFRKKDRPTKEHPRILQEQLALLYQQFPLVILAQLIVPFCLYWGLPASRSDFTLHHWLMMFISVPLLGAGLFSFYHYKRPILSTNTWIVLYAILTFISAIGWAIPATVLMPDASVHQVFVIIIILGLSAGAVPLLSVIYFVYVIFLICLMIPLTIWLFMHSDLYRLLSYCGVVYVVIMLVSAYYFNKFLKTSLQLRYQNTNLDSLNQLLEEKVNERTSELTKSLALTESTLESTADGIMVVNLNGDIEYFNHQLLNIWRIQLPSKPNLNLQVFYDAVTPKLEQASIFFQKAMKLLEDNEVENLQELKLTHSVLEWYCKPHKIGDKTSGQVWSFRDITNRKNMEYQLAFQAEHDDLTGLPNRTALYHHIDEFIVKSQQQNTLLGLFFLDLDDFKLINDNMGHEVGDLLLKETAKRISGCIEKEDIVARFGGDEFIILHPVHSANEAELFARQIHMNIIRPIKLLDREVVISVCIGISIYPLDGEDYSTLLKNADMAMYTAKKHGRNTFKIYDVVLQQRNQRLLETQIELRNALTNKEFYLAYQPTISLKTGKMIGLETLVRWKHPTKGILNPLDFIAIAEQTGLIIPLGEWVFHTACEQNKNWHDLGIKPVRIAINISGVQLISENFVDLIKLLIKETGVDSGYLEIELTESVLMDNKRHNIQVLQQLHELGIYLSIDDFGIGYSSLNYLSKFPVSKLKIAQPFIDDCCENEGNATIVEAIIALGHGLKMQVLAEGIENEKQLQFLQKLGCDEVQGFLFCEPLSAQEIEPLLMQDINFLEKGTLSKTKK